VFDGVGVDGEDENENESVDPILAELLAEVED
jgi:hypothetical protein